MDLSSKATGKLFPSCSQVVSSWMHMWDRIWGGGVTVAILYCGEVLSFGVDFFILTGL